RLDTGGGEIDCGPPRLREGPRIAAPGDLGEMGRAAADLEHAIAAGSYPSRRDALQQRLAISAPSQRRMREAQQVRDGAFDFVEPPARRQPVGAVMGAVGIFHRSALETGPP